MLDGFTSQQQKKKKKKKKHAKFVVNVRTFLFWKTGFMVVLLANHYRS